MLFSLSAQATILISKEAVFKNSFVCFFLFPQSNVLLGFNSHLNREINHVFIPSDFGFLRILHLYAMAA
jgi:hypothetical protein